MIIDVLVCHSDGTQTIEKQEVADNWFDPIPPAPMTTEELALDLLTELNYRTTLLELGMTT